MEKQLTFTVFTPTYNRAHLLPRAYKSLQEQTYRDFEWLIVDDGSTDNTAELVKQWQQEADFPIRYYWQENRGMNAAINRGVELAMGQFFVKLDSDDWLAANTLEKMLYYWETIPKHLRFGYVGIAGLCATPDGKLVGTPFPKDVLDANAVTIRTIYRVKGDNFGANRTDVLREYFPYPEDMGPYVPESLIWNRIALKYQIRFVNEIFAYVNYQQTGLSNSMKTRIKSAAAMRLTNREFAELPIDSVPLSDRFRAYAKFVRYSLHAKVGLAKQFSEVKFRGLWTCAVPIGVVLYLKDRLTVK